VAKISRKSINSVDGELIRSSFTIGGVPLFCFFKNGKFEVCSRWQRFHLISDINEALVVFEGLCFTDVPSRTSAKNLIIESRRNLRRSFQSITKWHNRVIDCAIKRDDGFKLKICGSKSSLEHWSK